MIVGCKRDDDRLPEECETFLAETSCVLEKSGGDTSAVAEARKGYAVVARTARAQAAARCTEARAKQRETIAKLGCATKRACGTT